MASRIGDLVSITARHTVIIPVNFPVRVQCFPGALMPNEPPDLSSKLAPTDHPVDDPSLYINRELSWLQFNRRVLAEGQNASVPLLERVKFLAIFSSNLDEFFMVRVGNLQQKIQAGITRTSGADKTFPRDQLDGIIASVRSLVADQYTCLNDHLVPALAKQGITLCRADQLTQADLEQVKRTFDNEVFPVLTPLAIDPAHPFPHLQNKSLNLAVMLRRPRVSNHRFAVVRIPTVLPRLVELSGQGSDGIRFIPLEDVVRLHLGDMFPGMAIDHVATFRVTRDSEYELDEHVEDLLEAIEEEVRKRRLGSATRLEIEAHASAEIERFLVRSLKNPELIVSHIPGMLDLTGLFQLHGLPGFVELRDPQFVPQPVPAFTSGRDIWAAIRAEDVLVHHPYESFSHVLDFIEEAADDDRVLAIKQTLYRTSSDSPIVRALARAAEQGKDVAAVIELKARLDEERNILWARQLEEAGVHVVFGPGDSVTGLKVHCKAALVVRREDDGIRRYVHLATGNYNPMTARIYTDLGFFTTRREFAEDVTELFNYLTGHAEMPRWRKLIVAPSHMLRFVIDRIDQEAEHARAGRGGRVIAKMNGLLEPMVVQALYRASQAGVKIDLICRGICALRPGIPGVSENIRVRSIVDRFLEHSRIYYFENAGNPDVYAGSADWMDRNLSRRVEVLFPVEDPALKDRLINEILMLNLVDTVKSWELLPDGDYRRIEPAPREKPLRCQEHFLHLAEEQAMQNTRRNAELGEPLVGGSKPRENKVKRRKRS